MIKHKRDRLLDGETFITKEYGNSMSPLILSGQEHKLEPITWEECKIKDIVYCKVNGKYYTHLVKAINNQQGLLIGNNKGKINGWTKNVYGRVIK